MDVFRYDTLTETVKLLPAEEKEDLKFLIERYLIDEKREEIYKDYQESLKEVSEGRLEFSSDVDKLREIIEK